MLTSAPKNNSIHSAGWVGFKPSDYGTTVNIRFRLNRTLNAILLYRTFIKLVTLFTVGWYYHTVLKNAMYIYILIKKPSSPASAIRHR